MKRCIVWWSVLFLALFAAATASSASDGTLYRLPVFQTSDIHGYIVDTSNEPYEYRLAFIADKVNDARAGDPDRTVLLDAGDNYQGNTLSNLLEGNPISSAFALMRYDTVTLGNHEFDWEIGNVIDADGTMQDYVTGGAAAENTVSVVISNLYLNREKVTFAKDCVILEKKAVSDSGDEIVVRVAVVGFALDYSTSIMNRKFSGAGFTLSEDFDALERLAAELEKSGACDATILLTHSDAAEIVSHLDSSTAFDLILGGHSHENECGETEWGLVYLEPACYGAAYTRSELVFGLDEAGKPRFASVENAGTVSVIEDRTLLWPGEDTADELDPAVSAAADEAILQIGDILNEKIGYITVSALKLPAESDERDDSRGSTAGNWMCSLFARTVGADIAWVNGGGIRVNFFVPEGEDRRDISVSDVYAMFPFNNHVYCLEITWAELLDLVRYSLTHAGGTLCTVATGIDIYYTGFEVNALVKDGRTVYENGRWSGVLPEDKVRIAATDYVCTTIRQSDKESGALSNPLNEWIKTDRLIESEPVDSEEALRILREEAAQNDGYLAIDTKTHYIEGTPAASLEEPAAANGTVYEVAAGDTLWMISRRFYGTGTRYRTIAQANGIANPDLIYAGTKLVILPD